MHISRRHALLILGILGLLGCDPRRLPDSRRQVWVVLLDLSGSAVADREHYVQELEGLIGELARSKPTAVIHVVGFSAFARPLTSGQAQWVVDRIPEVTEAIRRLPPDARTDLAAAFAVAHELLRKSQAERRILWVLSDGIHDPTNRWRTRPPFAVPLPRELPLTQLRDSKVSIHWDDVDEHQFLTWQQALDGAGIPAILHLRGFIEPVPARLRRLPGENEERGSGALVEVEAAGSPHPKALSGK